MVLYITVYKPENPQRETTEEQNEPLENDLAQVVRSDLFHDPRIVDQWVEVPVVDFLVSDCSLKFPVVVLLHDAQKELRVENYGGLFGSSHFEKVEQLVIVVVVNFTFA